MDIPLTYFIKSLYPTYSHYLESLQASGQMESMAFESLVEKVAECEKAFAHKITQHVREIMCLTQKVAEHEKSFGNKITYLLEKLSALLRRNNHKIIPKEKEI